MGATAPTRTRRRPRRGLGPRLQRGHAACLDIGTASPWQLCTEDRSPRGRYSSASGARRAARPESRAPEHSAAYSRAPRRTNNLASPGGGASLSERGGGPPPPGPPGPWITRQPDPGVAEKGGGLLKAAHPTWLIAWPVWCAGFGGSRWPPHLAARQRRRIDPGDKHGPDQPLCAITVVALDAGPGAWTRRTPGTLGRGAQRHGLRSTGGRGPRRRPSTTDPRSTGRARGRGSSRPWWI